MCSLPVIICRDRKLGTKVADLLFLQMNSQLQFDNLT